MLNARKPFTAFWIALYTLCWSTTLAQTAVKPLGEGVTLKQYVQPLFNSSQVVNVLEVDLKHPSVRIEAVLAAGTVHREDPTKGREAVSAMVSRTSALAGINADFFPFTGDPLGIHIQDGELVSEPAAQRVAFGLTEERVVLFGTLAFRAQVQLPQAEPIPLHGVNRPVDKDECVLVTPRWGEKYSLPANAAVVRLQGVKGTPAIGRWIEATVAEPGFSENRICPVPPDGALLVATGTLSERLRLLEPNTTLVIMMDILTVGDQVALQPLNRAGNDHLASRHYRRKSTSELWKQASTAVGGGPWLVRNGQVAIDSAQQGFQNNFSAQRHPRTAVGFTADGKLLLVTVDGRQSIAAGMTLPELAQWMIQLGATEAINLDGGGSTALAVRGALVINSPSEGKERPVANGLVVRAPRPAVVEATPLQIEPASITLRSGETVRVVVRSPEKQEALNPDSLVFGCTGGVGFVDQSGQFTAIKMGKGTVSVLLPDDRVLQAEVTVLPGEPANLRLVQPTTLPSGAERFEFAVRVTDKAGNPCAGVTVQTRATGAFPESESTVTDVEGTARFFCTWDISLPAERCLITVTAGKLELQLKRPTTSR